jgi:hypothetical protein
MPSFAGTGGHRTLKLDDPPWAAMILFASFRAVLILSPVFALRVRNGHAIDCMNHTV